MCTRVANKMRLNLQYDEGGVEDVLSSSVVLFFVFCLFFCFAFYQQSDVLKLCVRNRKWQVWGLTSEEGTRHQLTSCVLESAVQHRKKVLRLPNCSPSVDTHYANTRTDAHIVHTTRHTGRATRDKTFHNSRQVFLGGGGLRHNHPVCMSCVNVTKNVEKNASGWLLRRNVVLYM